jgi:hypothetical protein
MGMLLMNDNRNQSSLLHTNIGNVLTIGVAFYKEYKPIHIEYKSGAPTELCFFMSTAHFDGKYIKGITGCGLRSTTS